MSLWRLPEILTIQLKRFSFRNLLWRDKIDQKVNFPIEYVPFFLLLSACFCYDSTPPTILFSFCIRQLDLSPYLSINGSEHGAVYDLFAVVNHYGGILYGHYTAFARCPAASSDKSQEDIVGKSRKRNRIGILLDKAI